MFSGEQTALMWNILKEILIKQAYKKDGKKPLEDLFNDMTMKLEPYLVNTASVKEGTGEGDKSVSEGTGEGDKSVSEGTGEGDTSGNEV